MTTVLAGQTLYAEHFNMIQALHGMMYDTDRIDHCATYRRI